MESSTYHDRLSGIQTLWTLVRQAHQPGDEARVAQEKLLRRYGGAVRRYLQGIVRDAEVADDLFQEFACRLIKGDLHGADPQRGRFRNFVKGVLFHLVADHHARRKRQPALLGDQLPEQAVQPPTWEELDRDLVVNWRAELLARSWQELQDVERRSGKPLYTVLRFRAENAKLSSTEMAHQLSALLGKPLTAVNFRQTLHRAREKFADILLAEVIESLDAPTDEQLHDELHELGLLEYCKPAMEKKAKS